MCVWDAEREDRSPDGAADKMRFHEYQRAIA